MPRSACRGSRGSWPNSTFFLGAFAVYPGPAAVGLLGLLITAALFLDILRQVFFGKLRAARAGFSDLSPTEIGILAALLALVVLIGVWPSWLLTLIAAGSLLSVAG